MRGGDEDHALAGPDDGGLNKQQKRAEDADLADAVEGESTQCSTLASLGFCGRRAKRRRRAGSSVRASKEEDEKPDGGDAEQRLPPQDGSAG